MSAILPALALAVALAMDAFAVALTQGARFRPGWKPMLAIAGTFGTLQGVMPLAGWALGAVALGWVERFDHWIAFALLAFLGLQMIRAGGQHREAVRPLSGTGLLAAGIATSVDALAAGITLPALQIDPATACLLIGAVTFVLSAIGVRIGARAGDRFGRPAEIAGGLLLIALGLRILLQHLAG